MTEDLLTLLTAKPLHVFFFLRQAESFLIFLLYEPGMFLKCFLMNQVQITIPMIPWFRYSYVRAPKKKQKQNKKTCKNLHFKGFSTVTESVDRVICTHKMWRGFFFIKIEMCRVMNRCVLKILSFKDCLVQNSFLKIPKSQPGYVSYIFLIFFAFWVFCFLKAFFLD